jgi:hypothetical protein
MATVQEEFTIKEQRSVVLFLLWTIILNTKDTHKDMFPVYCWKCLSRKEVYNGVKNISLRRKMLKRRCGSGGGAEVAETTAK